MKLDIDQIIAGVRPEWALSVVIQGAEYALRAPSNFEMARLSHAAVAAGGEPAVHALLPLFGDQTPGASVLARPDVATVLVSAIVRYHQEISTKKLVAAASSAVAAGLASQAPSLGSSTS